MIDKIVDWCYYNFGTFLIILGIALISSSFIFMVFFANAISEANERYHQEVERQNKVCTEKGGELLERTYRVGKTNRSEYVCVDKKIIIE